eukprot:33675-Eustigmatos_ZCMA.PRE.1
MNRSQATPIQDIHSLPLHFANPRPPQPLPTLVIDYLRQTGFTTMADKNLPRVCVTTDGTTAAQRRGQGHHNFRDCQPTQLHVENDTTIRAPTRPPTHARTHTRTHMLLIPFCAPFQLTEGIALRPSGVCVLKAL